MASETMTSTLPVQNGATAKLELPSLLSHTCLCKLERMLIGLSILVFPNSLVLSRRLFGHGTVVTQRLVVDAKIHANLVVGITVDANQVFGIWFHFYVYVSIGCNVFWKWSLGIRVYELDCIFSLFDHDFQVYVRGGERIRMQQRSAMFKANASTFVSEYFLNECFLNGMKSKCE